MSWKILAIALVFASTGLALAKAPPGTDPNSPRAHWFQAQHNLRVGHCCAEADGHGLKSNEWRIVEKPFWDCSCDKPAGDIDPREDETVQYQVNISGKWWNIHNWQLDDPAVRKDSGLYVDGAEVWYSPTGGMNGPTIYCFLPASGV